jgi:hypothetical protein
MSSLRSDLLAGITVAVVGDAPSVCDALAKLGARVEVLASEQAAREPDDGADPVLVDALVYDGETAFGDGGADGLRACTEQAWAAISQVAVKTLIAQQRRGKVVLIAPRHGEGAGPLAQAACAALENLARTLSVEWARYGITVTTIAPGAGTSQEQVAQLACYVVSPAGDYFSGCRFSLGTVVTAP